MALASGETLDADLVVSGMDLARTTALVDDAALAAEFPRTDQRSPVVKLNLALGELPRFRVRDRESLPLGGTIDYEAGTLKRPPSWVTDFGFEWLYRLGCEPRQRWRRYLVHQPPVLHQLARQRLGLYRNPFA